MRLTEADVQELARRSALMFNTYGWRRAADVHEINVCINRLRAARVEGNLNKARAALERAMLHGLIADDMLAKVQEGG